MLGCEQWKVVFNLIRILVRFHDVVFSSDSFQPCAAAVYRNFEIHFVVVVRQ